jgi:hypothetical protein
MEVFLCFLRNDSTVLDIYVIFEFWENSLIPLKIIKLYIVVEKFISNILKDRTEYIANDIKTNNCDGELKVITGEIKNKIDSLWDIFAAGGLTNPLDVIEQITYLRIPNRGFDFF